MGLDGGGSGSRAALIADDGRVLAILHGPPATAAMPQAELQAALAELLLGMAGRCGGGDLRVLAGFAGAGRPEPAETAGRALASALAAVGLTTALIELRTDAHIALFAVAPESQEPAAVLIAGTGSIALAGAGDALARAGGWGRYLGDEGGGFWLGRRALEVAARAADGRCPRGRPLAEVVLRAAGLHNLDAAVLAAPDLWAAPRRVAALAPLVLRAAADGDPVADDLVREAGRALAELLRSARSAARLPAAAPTGLAGGLWRAAGGCLRAALTDALPPEIAATCRPLAVPPEVGAACHLLTSDARRRLIAAALWVE